ncbi:hypothetical protein LPTSP2_38650 [Leptospira ellinghausenii]|uniref:Uncharacterized protein n=1 Tax=Leptospira ellinghausenii TaxID=1917822 RepID=A0A2P2DIU1_9LEPT|nr:hypothetical protein [Leptospira ellinghausenii]GBF44562.1 hypothetical protein LPTSP2_38650 [Leptospira ellinghausenii]
MNTKICNNKEKIRYQRILKILNNYYLKSNKKDTDSEKRERIAVLEPDKFSLKVKYLGQFSYELICESEEITYSWIHIDSISDERIRMQELGVHDHPIFEIDCLGDIFMQKDE